MSIKVDLDEEQIVKTDKITNKQSIFSKWYSWDLEEKHLKGIQHVNENNKVLWIS